MQGSSRPPSVALSVVIAVREAEETIGRDVRGIADHLRAAGVTFELLAVNDGCCDNSLAVLRLLEGQIPELRVCPGDARGRAFVRGTADARGEMVALLDAAEGGLPLLTLDWALARVGGGADAVVFRGRCIIGRRLACLPAVVRAGGRGNLFQHSFERNARGLEIEIVGTRPKARGLLGPVLRFLAA
jgi:glycosyltransferase involved in cell wall biosynthesis